MKKFNVLLIAIFALGAIASISSCCSVCNKQQQPQPQQIITTRGMHQKVIARGAYFTDGYLFDCLVNNIAQVRDQNGNHPKAMPVNDPMIIKRLDPNQGGWNFASCGPCRVGGGCDVKVWVYDDNGYLVENKDPEIIESTWVLDEFYGESLRKWSPADTSLFHGKGNLPIWAHNDKSFFQSVLIGQNCKIVMSPELAILVQKDPLKMNFLFGSQDKLELKTYASKFYLNKDLRTIVQEIKN